MRNNVTIQDFINILPNGYIQKSNRYYFDCPYCESPKEKQHFNVYPYNGTYLFKCFKGNCKSNDTKGTLRELKKHKNISNFNDYPNKKVIQTTAPAPAEKETKNNKYSLEEKEKCISTLFNISSLTSEHKKKFIDKRDFEPTEYYKSYSRFTIKELEKLFPKNLIIECGLYKKNLNNRILIFHPDINKNIITYRSYSFTAPKEYKKLSPKNECGLKKIPYRVDLLNEKIKEIIITEGEEKADSVNVLEIKELAFISMGGINTHGVITTFAQENKEYCIKRDFTILFDRKKETKFSEEIQAFKLAKKLTQLGFNCHICFMPEIPNCNESDIDSYLKYVVSIGKNPKHEIEKILSRKVNYKDLEKYLIASDKKETEKIYCTPSQIWKTPEETNINYDTLENIREKTIDGIKEFIGLDNKNHGTCLVKNPPGTGKSFIMKDISDNFGFRINFASYTKELRNNNAEEMKNAKIYHSLIDRYKELIEKANLNLDKEKESIIFDNIIHLINNGYPEKIEKYLRNTLNIKDKLDKNYFKDSFRNINTLVLTHSLFVNHQKNNVDYSKYFDCVVIDESITNLLKGKIKLSIGTLKGLIIYLKNKEIKDFLELTIEFMQTSKEYSRSFLYFNFNEFLEKKNIDIGNLKTKLKKSSITFDRKKLEKELFKDNVERSFLPNKNELEIFIKEFIENNFNNVVALKGFNDTLELSINYFNKISYGNKKDEKLIILDATADKEILKCFGFNVVQEIEFNIKSENLEVIQDFSHTFTTSSQKNKDGTFQNKYNNLYTSLIDENTFCLSTLELRNNLESLGLTCSFGNYQKDDKATNKYKDCTKAIISPPKVNHEIVFSEVRMLRPDINNFETRKVYVGTGLIKDGLELFNEEIEFIEPFINKVVEQQKQVLMVQGLSRIRRDFTTNKKVIILGNISLKKYGIIPNEIKNFLEKNKPSNKIYDLLKTDLVDFFSKNDILFNQNLDNYLLSNVTPENKNKVQTQANSVIQGFEDKNTALMLSITMFVQVSIKEYINGDTNKHSYNSNTDNLPLFTKKIKDRLIKSFDLKKSFFDLDNKRHYFYYKSTSDIKDIKAKINLELNLTAPAPAEKENILSIPITEKIETKEKSFELMPTLIINNELNSLGKINKFSVSKNITSIGDHLFDSFKELHLTEKRFIDIKDIKSIYQWVFAGNNSTDERNIRAWVLKRLLYEYKQINRDIFLVQEIKYLEGKVIDIIPFDNILFTTYPDISNNYLEDLQNQSNHFILEFRELDKTLSDNFFINCISIKFYITLELATNIYNNAYFLLENI